MASKGRLVAYTMNELCNVTESAPRIMRIQSRCNRGWERLQAIMVEARSRTLAPFGCRQRAYSFDGASYTPALSP